VRAAAAAVAAACACGGGATAPVAPPGAGGSDGSGAAAVDTRELVDCAAIDGPAIPGDKLPAGWSASGRTLTETGGGAAIGVIADAGGSAPTTLAAIGRLRAQLDAAHVDVVVSLGGMGSSAGDLEAALAALATGAKWPLVALPGDTEPVAAFDAAMTALRAHGVTVVDGRLARWLELPGATVATIPGAGAAVRSAAGGDGCGYHAGDVDAIAKQLAAKPGVRVVASTEAPRGADAGEPTGDLALPPHAADVVVHAEADAATVAPAAGGRDGAAASLSPGSTDTTARLPGPAHPASAAILAIHDGHWTWRVVVDKP
jgi:hypothetical protein